MRATPGSHVFSPDADADEHAANDADADAADDADADDDAADAHAVFRGTRVEFVLFGGKNRPLRGLHK